jgi:hypothetical protein
MDWFLIVSAAVLMLLFILWALVWARSSSGFTFVIPPDHNRSCYAALGSADTLASLLKLKV